MPACLIHFCVNAKVTCMLDAYCALVVVSHKHLCCDAIGTQHPITFLATLERIMLVYKITNDRQCKRFVTEITDANKWCTNFLQQTTSTGAIYFEAKE
jgi:hypothetical protein